MQKQTSYYGIKGDKNDNDEIKSTKKESDIENFEKWNHTQIVKWVMTLENGLLMDYEDILSDNLKRLEVTGMDLMNIEEEDVTKWGIDKYVQVKMVYKNIKSLTNKEGK